MELSSSETILGLMQRPWKPHRARRHPAPIDLDRMVNPDRRPRCTCGICERCVENARWERIFAEKFADPNYYSSRQVRHSSPLASV